MKSKEMPMKMEKAQNHVMKMDMSKMGSMHTKEMLQTTNKIMTKSKQLIIGGVVGGIVALVLAFTYFSGLYTKLAGAVGIAFDPANCYITSPITGTSATTTLSYMTAGTATTTVTCGMGNDGAKSALLVVEVNASSTATSFNIYPEESMDGVDWFPIAINQNSSSTAPYNLTQRTFYEFIFASSTVGGVGAKINS